MKHFKVPLFKNDYSFRELLVIFKVFRSKWFSMGKQTQLFEKEFSHFLNISTPALAVSNGTAALLLALKLCNIKKNDEVLLPALTFVADINVVTSIEAKPILIDSKSHTDWNIDIKDVRKKITKKTKAIIFVHYAGYPVDITELQEIAKQYNITLIEDAAHAIGSKYQNNYCGRFADFSIFSLYANKNISAGEGGVLIAKNKQDYEKAFLMRSHGITLTANQRAKQNGKVGYDVKSIGFNYRITEISSAIARVQLKKLTKNNLKRKKLSNYYQTFLKDFLTIPFLEIHPQKKSSYHIFPVLLPKNISRDLVIQKLKECKIQTSIHYPSFKSFSFYSYLTDKTPIADDISSRVLTLPLFPTMKKKQVKYVVEKLLACL